MGLGRRMKRTNSPGYGNNSAGGDDWSILDVAVEASQLTDAVNLQGVGTRLPGERGTEQ